MKCVEKVQMRDCEGKNGREDGPVRPVRMYSKGPRDCLLWNEDRGLSKATVRRSYFSF